MKAFEEVLVQRHTMKNYMELIVLYSSSEGLVLASAFQFTYITK